MTTLNVYDVGDLVRLVGTLNNAAGAALDPSTLVVKVKAPSGTTTTYTFGSSAFPIRTGLGTFYVDVTPSEPGEHDYKFASSGTGQAVDEGTFVVRTPKVT